MINRLNNFVNGSNEIKIRSYKVINLFNESINGWTHGERERERERERETEREREREREQFDYSVS